jgi:arylformamidase
MTGRGPEDWEAEYDVPGLHPDLEDYVERWGADAAAFRRAVGGDFDVPYAAGGAKRIDFFSPSQPPVAMVVFFHGGYWVEGTRKVYSHLAAGPLGNGLAVGIVGYDLAPGVDLATIVAQAKAAVAFAADRSALPIVVAGHSAGGHLAAMAIADEAVPTSHGVTVSGIFDLEPFLELPINKLLRLDARTAKGLSPVNLDPPPGATLRLAVGEEETAAFHGQSHHMAQRWSTAGAQTEYVSVPRRHHLSVIEELAVPEGTLAGLCLAAAEDAVRTG